MNQQILAIDDSADIHELLAVRLRPEGVTLHQALDAQEGLNKAIELQPDLILLDLDLPGVTGFEVCRQLKADPRTAALQVIFLTGTCEVDSKVRGFDMGAIDYVTKPFDAAELRARVRSALRTKRLQDLLANRAQIDGLTGIYNRAHFNTRLHEVVQMCIRHARPFSLVMADLDHFKKVNDTYGHPVGDTVLQVFAEVLSQVSRTSDHVCRYGGEEFALILPDSRAAEAMFVIERAQRKLSELDLRQHNGPLKITASWGLTDSTLAQIEELVPALLLKRADAALYEAKRAGRNCARAWKP